MRLDPFFHLPAGQVRERAEPFLTAPAQEVLVDAAILFLDFGVDESADAPSPVAAIAKDHALEVVAKHSVSISLLRSSLPNFLYAIEELLTDDRFVPSMD
ncbi:MAG: hypothetical protein ACR2LF_11850 [Jatrophihabitantaceae bacterium]